MLRSAGGSVLRSAALRTCRGLATIVRAEPPIVDTYNPNRGYIRGWRAWCESTLSIVQLRKRVQDWGVPQFREEARQLYQDVSLALAAADVKSLRRLTTPSCFAPLEKSLKKRPPGQRHSWEAQDIEAKVLQVRLAHNAKEPEHQFAQVTCGITAKLVWRIEDAAGEKVGGLGTAVEPFAVDDLWVFERLMDADDRWRIKSRLVPTDDEGRVYAGG